MKKRFLSLLALLLVGLLSICSCSKKPENKSEKHLITDQYGEYGGSLDKTEYGEGAPANGELDHKDTEYYSINDYYNMKSSDSRLIIPEFQGYQQTMADSDGLACLLMVLNHEGEDIVETYNEEKLVEIQESITGKKVYGNGSTAEELVSVMERIGYTAKAPTNVPGEATQCEWMMAQLKQNKYILVKYQDGVRYQWHLVIGLDNCGNEETRDDVIIFADPFDASDHYQDGYTTYHFDRFSHWWLHKLIDGNAQETKECVIINSKKTFDFTKVEKDPVKITANAPEKHVLLNADGTTGGSYGDGRYSGNSGSTGLLPNVLATTEHPDLSYFAIPDIYNMEDTDTRKICTNYWTFKQTMSSSCGISSVMMCLQYYGFDWSKIGQFITEEARLGFVGYNKDTNPKFGGVAENANDRKQEAIVMVYCQGDEYFDTRNGRSFYNYGGVGSGNLMKVPETLGFTSVEYGRYYRNNFNASKIPFKTLLDFESYALNHLKNDEPVIISWNPTGGHWETVIGIDTMGTLSTWDDVVLLADSSDGVDHYRDGYNTLPLQVMYGTWYNSSGSTNQQYVCFTRANKNSGLLK